MSFAQPGIFKEPVAQLLLRRLLSVERSKLAGNPSPIPLSCKITREHLVFLTPAARTVKPLHYLL